LQGGGKKDTPFLDKGKKDEFPRRGADDYSKKGSESKLERREKKAKNVREKESDLTSQGRGRERGRISAVERKETGKEGGDSKRDPKEGENLFSTKKTTLRFRPLAEWDGKQPRKSRLLHVGGGGGGGGEKLFASTGRKKERSWCLPLPGRGGDDYDFKKKTSIPREGRGRGPRKTDLKKEKYESLRLVGKRGDVECLKIVFGGS